MSKRRILLYFLAGAFLVTVPVFWILTAPRTYFEKGDPRLDAGDAERGRLVFNAGGCASCHAQPGQEDRLKLGGGMALSSPYGVFRPPNISPDPDDGIGRWTVADLGNALVSGVSPSGEHYYPAFPYVGYTSMQFRDISDLYAYLMTLPRVRGKTPAHDLTPLLRIRRLLGGWKLLFFRQRHSEAAMNGDPLHDRGGYIVESLSHCAQCHSTRSFLGSIKPETRFAGGVDAGNVGYVPNITPERIGDWSERDIAEMLKSGNTPDHGRVGSSMADVVANASQLPQRDRDAIARYIKSLPKRPTPQP
jgi:mono/diheme cytochrome c family protein